MPGARAFSGKTGDHRDHHSLARILTIWKKSQFECAPLLAATNISLLTKDCNLKRGMSIRTIYAACQLGLSRAIKRDARVVGNCIFTRNLHKSDNTTVSNVVPKVELEPPSITKILPTGHRSLKIGFQDDHASDFQYIWLRDNCKCPSCIHPENQQKLVDTVSLNINIKPNVLHLDDNGHLMIVWPDQDGKEHTSIYEPEWLYRYGKGFELDSCDSLHDPLPRMVTWDGEKIQNIMPEISYDEVMNTEEGLNAWLELIYKYGVAIMRGVPSRKDEVIKVVERFAYIKKTKWGQSFDVLCEPVQTDPKHLAYTGMYLEHHTDMNYLEKSPGLQALHCLKADSSNDAGGQSFFVDGFHIAKWLQKHHPASYHILSTTIVKFKILSHGMYYSNRTPIFCTSRTGDIQEVHYNTRTMAPLEGPAEAVQPFYEAYRLIGMKMREKASEFAFNLVPGDLVAFNNRRILHGRTSFDPQIVSRHLQGCYGDIDEVITRYRTHIASQKIPDAESITK